MEKFMLWIFGLSVCFATLAFADQEPYGACATGWCKGGGGQEYAQDTRRYNLYLTPSPDCAPGDCYLFNELVPCSPNDYSCKDGTRRIWSYRAKYYTPDNSELAVNLHKKLCPTAKTCMWPY